MLLTDLITQWKYDFKYRKIIFSLEIIGTINSIIASILISMFPKTIDLSLIFIFWTIGSVSMGVSSYLRHIAFPTLLMIIYTMFNIIGLYKLL